MAKMSNKATIEEVIVALNDYKLRKPDEETVKQVNSLQRRLEEMCGKKAVEIDETYDYEYGVTD